MSHFTVCVRVPADLVKEAVSIEGAVKKMLAPYQENNMGDCPKEFLEFHDQEDEYREEYESGSTEMVRCEDGTLAYPWDARFRVPGSLGLGSGTHRVPNHLTVVSVPHKERFASLEAYAADWHSAKQRDTEKGRYGYWENPNKKWDWWTIGGRWSGFFPVRDGVVTEGRLGSPGAFGNEPTRGGADIVHVSEIDFDQIGQQTNERAERFWGEWQRLIAGEKLDSFDGPRSQALRVGLLDVNRGALTDDERTRCIPWRGLVPDTDARSAWHDVYKVVSKEEFLRDYLIAFNPISTFAVLDESGWHEAGRMGWFGVSSDTPDSFLKQANDFPAWLRAAPADAWLVLVDCHI